VKGDRAEERDSGRETLAHCGPATGVTGEKARIGQRRLSDVSTLATLWA
jgi:hypothetical protein